MKKELYFLLLLILICILPMAMLFYLINIKEWIGVSIWVGSKIIEIIAIAIIVKNCSVEYDGEI